MITKVDISLWNTKLMQYILMWKASCEALSENRMNLFTFLWLTFNTKQVSPCVCVSVMDGCVLSEPWTIDGSSGLVSSASTRYRRRYSFTNQYGVVDTRYREIPLLMSTTHWKHDKVVKLKLKTI